MPASMTAFFKKIRNKAHPVDAYSKLKAVIDGF